MSTRIEDRPVTADELLRMPERGFRLELVRGRVKTRPFRGAMEGRLGAALAVRLLEHVRRDGDLTFGTGAERQASAERLAELLQLVAASREYQFC